MEAKFNINTTQNVNIELKIAGVGERLVAIIIDYLVLIGVTIIVSILVNQFKISQNTQLIIWAIYSVVLFLYHFFSEWLLKGQSIGKKYKKIKVIHHSGQQASVMQLLVRNLIRIVDSFYGLGLLVIFISKKSQRLGDLASGTMVVKDVNVVSINDTAFVSIDKKYVPTFNKIDILRLNEQDMDMIKEITERTIENMNWGLVRTLAQKISEKANIEKGKIKSLEFLKTVRKDYQYYDLE
jgi:uncharacterized RDD family membrane protein YckC